MHKLNPVLGLRSVRFLAFASGLLITSALLPRPSVAADITGKWSAPNEGRGGPARGGPARDTLFAFIQDGDRLTGYMSSQQGDTAISDGKISGEEFSFTIARDTAEGVQKTEYKGRITPEGLSIMMPGFGGRGGREMVAHRISSERPAPLPPKILITEMKDVPDNRLAKTPPMGWNSWNKFRNGVSDKVVREIADAMANNGMKDAGYQYVNIDDTWQGTRDAQGNIRGNEKFPDMKALADYVHSKGLKLGLYSSPGPKTCAGYEGSYQHEERDAKTYAAWGIDYLKYDWCSARNVYETASMPAVYAKMGKALADSGRSIVFSLCQYGLFNVGDWAARAGGNLWRTTGDIRDSWDSMAHIGFDLQTGREKFAGRGHWNDPDMLEIGNGGMSDTEYRTHMSLWSLLAAPLLAGNDLRDVAAPILGILTNQEVIAVDQDELGKQGVRVAKNGETEVWVKPLSDGAKAAGLFNRSADTARITARWSDLGLGGAAKVRDLWAHADRGSFTNEYSAEVPPHGVV
ncbi:MAG: glycoside hydrolase family 27 protein, partial [Acidobacteriia bacterium]|nr:glycoside hydrolase family 27 protein [Terriglobia bacterium]